MTNPETVACRTTQHCAFHGWCRRCDPDFAAVMSRVNVAIQRTDADDTHWGPLYAAVAEALRPAAVSVPSPAPRADDRATVLREAADGFDRHAVQILDGVGNKAVFVAKALRDQAAVWREAAETLRRLAAVSDLCVAGEQQNETPEAEVLTTAEQTDP